MRTAIKRKIKCGIIGCGLMGREFAVATLRWPALLNLDVQPEIIAICDLNENLFGWYTNNFDSIKMVTKDYKDLLSIKDIEVIYCSVPHNLHELIYIDIINAGKNLLGEKPFGIDIEANKRILETIVNHPEVLVRCSSEFPYYPGAHEVHKLILENKWGKIIEVNAGFLHSSDINFEKPINWKRIIATNGEYGCLGDLGMHTLHLPIRTGWFPNQVFASLSKIVKERPDGMGGMMPCETWDNATMFCKIQYTEVKYEFPLTLKTYRIAPGEINTWFIEVIGTEFSARYSTKYPKTLQTMHYKNGGKQEWRNEDLGYNSLYKTITGSIFEFGFTDAILQMWAAFIDELSNPVKSTPFKCVTPGETYIQHQILSAALESGKLGNSISLNIEL